MFPSCAARGESPEAEGGKEGGPISSPPAPRRPRQARRRDNPCRCGPSTVTLLLLLLLLFARMSSLPPSSPASTIIPCGKPPAPPPPPSAPPPPPPLLLLLPPSSSSSCHGDRRGRRWSGKHHSRTIATAAAGIPSLPLMMTSECRQGRWPTQGGRRRRGREGGRGGRGGRRGVAAVEDQVQRLRRAQIQRLRWGGRREEGNRRVYGMRVIKDNYQDTKPCMHPN